MKKKFIKLFILVTVPLFFLGCSLDPILTQNYTEDVGWTNDENLNLNINKFYQLIGQSYYNPNVNDDCLSDIMKKNLWFEPENMFIYNYVEITPANNYFNNWLWGHAWALDCCRFLEGLEKHSSNFSLSTKKRAEAEIRFFRAYVYFVMARRFGASLVLYKTLPPSSEKYHPRSTPEETWDFIEEDLDFAAENLPIIDIQNKGKLTKGAAYGLKSRIMLYAERWKSASDAAKAVMDLNLYDLYPDYGELFKLRRRDGIENKESIIEYGYSSPEFAYVFDYYNAPPGDAGYAQSSPTDDLVSQYQMKDGTDFNWDNPAMAKDPYSNREKRFYASILYNGAPWKGREIEAFEGGKDGYGVGGGTTSTGYYMRKFMDETQTTGFQPGELTYYMLRYAEVLLNYSEAMAQQNNLNEALRALNLVRKRAGFTKDIVVTSKENFMPILQHERMIELAFEGHRFWDLRRWGLAKNVLNNSYYKAVKPTKNSDGTINYTVVNADGGKMRIYLDKYARFPIPSAEIQRNPLITQFDEWK